MTIYEIILLILSGVGIVGTFINARGNMKLSYRIWLFSNGGMVIMCLIVPVLWTLFVQYLIYWILAIYGLCYMHKKNGDKQ